jgi:hypothetical protein
MRGDIRRVLAFIAGSVLAAIANSAAISTPADLAPPVSYQGEPGRKLDVYIETYVTGYNTFARQTDDSPCISASGANICGRRDAIACPRFLKLGTMVEVNGRRYVCEDRTAPKYDHRFDISCDKDPRCPFKVTGRKSVKVLLQ